jgi:hypothetical protein
MKKYKSLLPLSIAPLLFVSTSFLKKTNSVEDKCRSTRSLSVYEVRLTFTGYRTFYGTAADCPIRKNGTVVLTGLLSGEENVSADDDIVYTGVLQLDIDMDICSARPEYPNKLCGITVTGSGPVKTELEIYSDGQDTARGAYIKIKYDPTLGKFKKSVVGDCDHQQLIEEEDMVPNETIATVFNGSELPITDRTLQANKKYVEKGDAGKLEVEVTRKVRP